MGLNIRYNENRQKKKPTSVSFEFLPKWESTSSWARNGRFGKFFI